MRNRIDVAVLGMGVGGLAVATMLARRGNHVTVYDQMERPGPVGSGFVLQPTGLEVLHRMGLHEEIVVRGACIERMLGVARPSGRTVLDVSYRPGLCGLAIQRRALFDALHRSAIAAKVEFHLGVRIAGYAGEGRPCPLLEDMSKQPRFDLLIDAMGAGSPTAERSRKIGYGALWATVPWDDDCGFDHNTLEQRYHRASAMAGVLPVGTAHDGAPSMATVFWSVRRGSDHSEWKERARALWPEMGRLLKEANPTHATYRHHTQKARPHARVLRIGDAWHATSPQLGQGANMALLDALSLDATLGRSSELEQGLAMHVRQRHGHVHFYQALSYVLTPFYQSNSRILPALRDRLVAPILARSRLAHRMVAAMVSGGMGNPLTRIIG